jgi:hypothetical protein
LRYKFITGVELLDLISLRTHLPFHRRKFSITFYIGYVELVRHESYEGSPSVVEEQNEFNNEIFLFVITSKKRFIFLHFSAEQHKNDNLLSHELNDGT